MTNTFKMLLDSFIKNKTHEFIKGRNTEYQVEDLIEKGLSLWQTKTAGVADIDEDAGEEFQMVEAEDVVVEL